MSLSTWGASIEKNIAGSSNGRTHPSGGWYLGSNPSPAALGRKKNLAGGSRTHSSGGWYLGSNPGPAALRRTLSAPQGLRLLNKKKKTLMLNRSEVEVI